MFQCLPALLHGIAVRIHAPWEFDPVAFDADGLEAFRGLCCGLLPCFVGIEGEADGFDLMGFDGLEKLFGKVRRAEGAGDAFHAVAVEGERVDDAFGEDDFAGC